MSKTNKIILAVVAVVVIIVVVVFAGQSKLKEEGTIKIGALIAQTGPGAFIGENYLNGLKLAQEDINKKGGINGKKIELFVEDNKNLGAESVGAFRFLELKKPDLVISTMSVSAVAVAPVIKESGIPSFISVVFANAKILSNDENSVSFFPKVSDDVAATVEDLRLNDMKKVGLLYLNTEYGKAGAESFKSETAMAGIEVVVGETFLGDGKDYSTPLLKILNKNPQAIYIVAVNALPIIREIKLRSSYPVIYTNLIPVFGNLVYKEDSSFEGVHLTASPVSIPGTDEYIKFREIINNRINIEKNSLGYTLVGYENLLSISKVFEKIGNSKDFSKIFSQLGKFQGVADVYDITGKDISMKLKPVIFQNGEIKMAGK